MPDNLHDLVKRHHSTGDMLAADVEFESPPVARRPRRPKSEGSFYVQSFKAKRASSFGVGALEFSDVSGAFVQHDLWWNQHKVLTYM